VGAFDLQVKSAEDSAANPDLRIVAIVDATAAVAPPPHLAIGKTNARARRPAVEMAGYRAFDRLRCGLVLVFQPEPLALNGLGLAGLLFAGLHHERVVTSETRHRFGDSAAAQNP